MAHNTSTTTSLEYPRGFDFDVTDDGSPPYTTLLQLYWKITDLDDCMSKTMRRNERLVAENDHLEQLNAELTQQIQHLRGANTLSSNLTGANLSYPMTPPDSQCPTEVLSDGSSNDGYSCYQEDCDRIFKNIWARLQHYDIAHKGVNTCTLCSFEAPLDASRDEVSQTPRYHWINYHCGLQTAVPEIWPYYRTCGSWVDNDDDIVDGKHFCVKGSPITLDRAQGNVDMLLQAPDLVKAWLELVPEPHTMTETPFN
ncbi:hypothetical protein AOL_s00091g48 [Orbilia oligospora ATCC 24927]|uniref:C2H2-type domain-containing protein n=1 Tax=Arthrobotrys oligospora (strain ATCC 24927 / CBS 115.81 / DSM 1491) TaxID=756982 RepID=G1XHZ6_ARTOA|nr:hypothetical protein AOL_s00091g48 [Orbilia oligospora ATCC 24927]EGX47227.1 hypothetical protein AOL_s00091g48 [Orbilia oligospora ATCC 24927]